MRRPGERQTTEPNHAGAERKPADKHQGHRLAESQESISGASHLRGSWKHGSLSLSVCVQAANSITRLEDLDKLTRLTTLHLRDNKMETLDGFSEHVKQLQYLNLR